MNNFATFIHLEITNRCNKRCWMCGRRKLEKEYPHLVNFNKDMDLNLAKSIIDQLPKNTVVHLAIDVDGNVSVCVRFDPLKKLVIGNAKKEKLIDIWNGEKRLKLLQAHIDGNRNYNEVCAKCDYWGIPVGY